MDAAIMDATDAAVLATYWSAPMAGLSSGDVLEIVPHQTSMAMGTGPAAAHRIGATTTRLSADPFPESTRFLTRLWRGASDGTTPATASGAPRASVPG